MARAVSRRNSGIVRLCLFGLLLLTAACADEPKPALEIGTGPEMVQEDPYAGRGPSVPLPRPKPERASPAPKPKTAAAPPEADAWTPEKLVGMTQAETERQLGPPSLEEESAPAKIWLYAADTCTVKVYFFPEMKSLVYKVLRYEVVGDEKSGERCFAEIRKLRESKDGDAATGRRAS